MAGPPRPPPLRAVLLGAIVAAVVAVPPTGRSALPDDALTAALLAGAAARVDDCKATGRCPRVEVQADALRGLAAYRSQAFAGGLRVPADAAWDGEDWVAGLGTATWDAPPAAAAADAAAAGNGFSAGAAAAGLDTWALGDDSLLPLPLHTPNFGLRQQLTTAGGGGAAGAPCVPDPAPVAPNPYALTAVLGVTAPLPSSNATVGAEALPYLTRRRDCAVCLLHVDTDALVAVVACPPGLSATNGEVAPASLGTLGVVGSSGNGSNGSGWLNATGAAGLLVAPPQLLAPGGGQPPSFNRSDYPFLPPGWPFAVFAGQRRLSSGGAHVAVPVAAFHFPSLHLGTGTATAVRGSYPLVIVTRGSAVVNVPLRVEPGSAGGFRPALLPSRAGVRVPGGGGGGTGGRCAHPSAVPTRDLLFTLLLTAPTGGGGSISGSGGGGVAAQQRVVTSVADGQTLRGGWTAAVCVREPPPQSPAFDGSSSLVLAPPLAQCGSIGSGATGCACPRGYASRFTRRIPAGAEPDAVADALNVDLCLAALAAGESAGASGAVAPSTVGAPPSPPPAVVVTRDAGLASGGYGYNVTFVGIAGAVPPLTLASHLAGAGAAVTASVLSRGVGVAGAYRLAWRGAVTAPLDADASAEAVQAAMTAAFAPVGLLSVAVAGATVTTAGDVCRLLTSAGQRRTVKLGSADAFPVAATAAGSGPASGGGGGGCASLTLARHGTAHSVTLTAALTPDQTAAAAASSTAPTVVSNVADGWAAVASATTGSSPQPKSWPAFFGPSAAYGDVLTLLSASDGGGGNATTATGVAFLALGSASSSNSSAGDATAATSTTTARMLPVHDADVAAAASGAPAHPFSTLVLWRYFASLPQAVGGTGCITETAAALSALSQAAGVNASTACGLASLPQPPSSLAGIYPPPLWLFTSCRLRRDGATSTGMPDAGDGAAPSGAPASLTGGVAGGLGAGSVQAWLARTPPAYLLGSGAGSIGGSWHAALGLGSNASVALRAVAAAALAVGNASGVDALADALAALLPLEAWLAGSTASAAAGTPTGDRVLPPSALQLLLARLQQPQGVNATALTASAASYSASAAAAGADAALSALRAACGYGADWRALPAVVDANGTAIAAANGSAPFPGSLRGSPPSLVAYLAWHAAVARLRLNATTPTVTAPSAGAAAASALPRWWVAALGLAAGDDEPNPPAVYRTLFNASAAPYDDADQPPGLDSYTPCCYGGAGGGVLAVVAGGDVTVGRHGVLAVDGQAGGDAPSGAGSAGGGGAGGTLLLSAGGVVAVRGALSARGGAGGDVVAGGDGVNATASATSAGVRGVGGAGGTIVLYGQALSIDGDGVSSCGAVARCRVPYRRRRRLDVSGGAAGAVVTPAGMLTGADGRHAWRTRGAVTPLSTAAAIATAASSDGTLTLAAAAPPGGVDYAVHGPASPAFDGLLPVPGRPVVAAPCNASAVTAGLVDDGCAFGPCGTLASVGRSHAHGSGRALRVRAGRDGDDGTVAGLTHVGPALVLPLRRSDDDGTAPSGLRLLPSQVAPGAFGSDAGYAAGVAWAARGPFSDATLTATADATLARLVGAWAAASALRTTEGNSSAGAATAAAASLYTAAAYPGEPSGAIANVSPADAQSLLRAALWSPACAPSSLPELAAPPAGCPDVARSLPRPDRVTVYVRIQPPPHRAATGTDNDDDGGSVAPSFDADDSADSAASSPFASPRLPSHDWGAHIALHDDSALPGYGVWALGPAAWPPPAVLPLLPPAVAGNATAALAALAAVVNVTAAGAVWGSAVNASWAAQVPLGDSGGGSGTLSPQPAAADVPCLLLAALQQSAAPSAPALAALLLGRGNATNALCANTSYAVANSTATTTLSPLAWAALVPTPPWLGSGPSSAYGGGGTALSAALSAPHPAAAIAALPPPVRDALTAWYGAVDELRAALFAGTNSTGTTAAAPAYAATSPSDVLLGVAATVGAADSNAPLAWRHGAGYRSSVPPWRVPAHAVPPPLADAAGATNRGAFLDAEEAGGAVLAGALADRAGLAAECGVHLPHRASAGSRRSGHWHKVDIFIDWAAAPSPTYRLRVDDVTVVAGARLPPGARGVTRIGLYATGGATVFFDGLYAGVDDTAGFECPSAQASGVDLTAPGVPSQTGWVPGDAGPPSVAWAETRHDSHLSRREAFAHPYHAGLVWGDGDAHTAFASDVGVDAVRAAMTTSGAIGVSGSGADPTGANGSTPEMLVLPTVPGALSAVEAAYGGSASAYGSPRGALTLATTDAAASTNVTPAGGLMAATLASYASKPPQARRGGVSAGALLASPVDGRHYWYGEHAGTGSSSIDAATAYYRRWYHAGGIGACSAASSDGGGSGALLRLWRAEGLLLRFANATLPARLGPLRPVNPFTSERDEDALLRVAAASSGSITAVAAQQLLLPGGGGNASVAGAAVADPLAPPPLQLRLQRPKALWNTGAAARLATCAAAAWGVGAGGSNATAPPSFVQPPAPIPPAPMPRSRAGWRRWVLYLWWCGLTLTTARAQRSGARRASPAGRTRAARLRGCGRCARPVTPPSTSRCCRRQQWQPQWRGPATAAAVATAVRSRHPSFRVRRPPSSPARTSRRSATSCLRP
jgi:hypothetical protein